MLKRSFDAIMERRAADLIAQVRDWLPAAGPVLDLGSGTGHPSAFVERELNLEVVAADVSDIHVTGKAPVMIDDGPLPFDTDTFSASMLFFMLAYPANPGGLLAEAARVTRGPIILVQSLYAGRAGHTWHRGREFVWTVLAFHVSRAIGYVPRDATFAMQTRRFYTAIALRQEVEAAGLRITAERYRRVLPNDALVVAAWKLEAK